MVMSAGAMSSQMYQRLRLKYNGSYLKRFCDSICFGSILSIVGKRFRTKDTGRTAGVGTGFGKSIIGVPSAIVKNNIIKISRRDQFLGSAISDIADAYSLSLAEQLNLATFNSTHSPVYLGSSIIVKGSIPVNSSEWSNNIYSQGKYKGMNGSKWRDFCKIIGEASSISFGQATGSINVVGAGGDGSGTGTGVGVIT